MQEGCRITKILVSLLVLCPQDLEDPQIPFDTLDACLCVEVGNSRLTCLTISVNAAISLLKDHQRPGEIEVDQSMAKIVQIQAL